MVLPISFVPDNSAVLALLTHSEHPMLEIFRAWVDFPQYLQLFPLDDCALPLVLDLCQAADKTLCYLMTGSWYLFDCFCMRNLERAFHMRSSRPERLKGC